MHAELALRIWLYDVYPSRSLFEVIGVRCEARELLNLGALCDTARTTVHPTHTATQGVAQVTE